MSISSEPSISRTLAGTPLPLLDKDDVARHELGHVESHGLGAAQALEGAAQVAQQDVNRFLNTKATILRRAICRSFLASGQMMLERRLGWGVEPHRLSSRARPGESSSHGLRD